MFDVFMYPDDKYKSALCTLAISYGMALMACSLDIPMKHASRKLDNKHVIYKIFLEDIWWIFVGTIAVYHWRGFWMLMDTFIFPENHEWGVWLDHAIGFLGQTLLLVSATQACRVAPEDGSETNGHGIDMGIDYSSVILLKYREYKLDQKTDGDKKTMTEMYSPTYQSCEQTKDDTHR
ncbi:hypothetical protein ScPMuIL_013751 [Solemya velum]